jgi:hypothetical protein
MTSTSSSSPTGAARGPSNVRRQWREFARPLGYGWVHPHVFLKSVATLAADTTLTSEELGRADERATKTH